MSRQVPQIRRNGNPLERQIIYSDSPAEFDPPDLENSMDESYEYSDSSSSDKEEFFFNSEETPNKHIALRASTAPARPLTEIEEFRRSSDFGLLEHSVVCCSYFIQTTDSKYDLESEEGQRACKKFLNQIERLCEVYAAETHSRVYRGEFTNAYRILYKEDELCYLTEILDSA
jgi:hypothetical protein